MVAVRTHTLINSLLFMVYVQKRGNHTSLNNNTHTVSLFFQFF